MYFSKLLCMEHVQSLYDMTFIQCAGFIRRVRLTQIKQVYVQVFGVHLNVNNVVVCYAK